MERRVDVNVDGARHPILNRTNNPRTPGSGPFAAPSESLAARVEAAEQGLYYSLIGVEECGERLAAEAEAAGDDYHRLCARLISSDSSSRMGDIEQAKELQVQLLDEARPWPVLERRVAVRLATTCWRLGERTESMHWISRAITDWPEDDQPQWRAEALMIFALLSISHNRVDYSLARHAAAAVERYCSPLFLACTQANFAELAAECGDLTVASEFADAATATLRKYPEVTAPLTLDSIARALLAVGDTAAAVELLDAAIELEREIGLTDVQGDPWLSLADALLVTGDIEGALAAMDAPRRARWAAKSAWTRGRDHRSRALILARLGRWEEGFAELLQHVEVYEAMRSIESDRVTAESETLQVVTEERRRAERFEQLAHSDPLTGLPNRRQVDSWLNAPDATLHIAIVDLDHFKQVNDTYSHAAGDLVLERVAEQLQSGMFSLDPNGETARVGRLGGEEFVVVWSDVEQVVAAEHARHLLELIRVVRFPEIDDQFRVTASIGMAFHQALIPGAQLLARADQALYAAKRAGRDRMVLAVN
jgi:diguanylate cyclase (GGDEF)-like protein